MLILPVEKLILKCEAVYPGLPSLHKNNSTICTMNPSYLTKLWNDFKGGIIKITWNDNIGVSEKHISNKKGK